MLLRATEMLLIAHPPNLGKWS